MTNSEIVNGTVISSRVRLARNIANLPFPFMAASLKDLSPYARLIDRTFDRMNKMGKYSMYKMSSINNYEKNALKELHLISNDLIKNKELGTAIISEDKTISIMVNEEDHLREQCMLSGFNLEKAYKNISAIDDEISKRFPIAFDKELGYLTACLTNIGTGMRASVMVFLPALTETENMGDIFREVSKLGLTIRGVYGEGSKAQGYLYQISNQISLGMDEKTIIQNVAGVVLKICEAEQNVRKKLLKDKEIEIKDEILRAYGILTNSIKYSREEFMRLMAKVKLGAYLGIIKIDNKKEIDKIIENAQPALIMLHADKELTPLERDLYRANMVKEKLKKIVISV